MPQYAIVRHHPRPPLRTDAGKNMRMIFYPDTVPMENIPAGDSKGPVIFVFDPIWKHLRAINSERGYNYTRSIGAMWINIPYKDGQTPKAESIHCGGNFVQIKKRQNGHVLLKSISNRVASVPDEWTWLNHPELHWKACAVNSYGDIINVANELDVYFLLIHETELWMDLNDLEVFPTIPALGLEVTAQTRISNKYVTGDKFRVFSYKLQGCSILGLTLKGWVYLRKATKPGENIETTTWHLETQGVIPPG